MTKSKPRNKINPRARGNAYQRDVVAWLQARGWTVRNFPVTIQPLMRGRSIIYRSIKQDVFGADIVARKGRNLIWVQVQRTKGGIRDRVEEFDRYFRGGLGLSEYLFIFSKIRGGWKIKNVGMVAILDMDLKITGRQLRDSNYGEICGGKLYLQPGNYNILFDEQFDAIERDPAGPEAPEGGETS